MKISLRSAPYVEGDTYTSGEFEDLCLVSVPIAVQTGKGNAHAVQDGVWLHLEWDDVKIEKKPQPALVFDGFRYRFDNRFTSPYGTSWWFTGWNELGLHAVGTEWDLLQTAAGIDPGGRDTRIWCQMCRWVPTKDPPDIALGEKQDRGPDNAAGSGRSAE